MTMRVDRRAMLRFAGGLALAGPVARAPAQPAVPPSRRRAIASSGEQLPVVGLGSWITFNVGRDAAARA
ncbi:MAG TPA: aldo/keto reductase, partial [Burkholderiaceae bacterium]|nr:aldo/keto reductase [Burkholderiaceae bacterium]